MTRRSSGDQRRERDCHQRAAVCRRRANEIADPQGRAFWEAQERRWLAIADDSDGGPRASDVPSASDARRTDDRSPEDDIEALIDVFHRVCADVMLDAQHQQLPHKVAHTILEAALAGEDDLDSLYARAVKAVSN